MPNKRNKFHPVREHAKYDRAISVKAAADSASPFHPQFGRGLPKDHLCQIIFKFGEQLLSRRFVQFFLYIHMKIKLRPLGAMFLTNQKYLNNFGREMI